MLSWLQEIIIFVELQDYPNKVKEQLIMYTSCNSLKSKDKNSNNFYVIKLIKQFKREMLQNQRRDRKIKIINRLIKNIKTHNNLQKQ
jgi:hypothetical protein